MKIIAGLGNPGKKYERTRHNAGFLAVEEIARSLRVECSQEKHHALLARTVLDSAQVILAKPQTYMNESGRAIGSIIRDTYSQLSELVVIHDDLDLAFGAVRIKDGGGHGGHNGLRSIIEHLGSSEFVRVRIGIGRPAPGMNVVDYVLSPFLEEERRMLPGVIERAAEAVNILIKDGPVRAMNAINSL